MKKHRGAIVGVTGYGSLLLDLLTEYPARDNLSIEAAVVINPEEAAPQIDRIRSRGGRIYPDLDSMLAQEKGNLDFCVIPTGISWHMPMAVACLDAGLHVHIEKPLAATLQEVQAIQDAERRSGRVVNVGFQDICSRSLQDVKKRVLAGEIGRIHTVRVQCFAPRNRAYYARNSWAGKAFHNGRWILDSPANNALSHSLNDALFLAGGTMQESARIDAVEAELYRVQPPVESFDLCATRVHVAGGVQVLYYACHACTGFSDMSVEVIGDAGSLRWVQEDFWPAAGPDGQRTLDPAVECHWTVRRQMLDAFLARMEGRSALHCTTGIARQHTLVINAMHEASPIFDIPGSFKYTEQYMGSEVVALRGIEETIRRAAGERKLFRELDDCPWARRQPANTFEVSNYTHFDGGLL